MGERWGWAGLALVAVLAECGDPDKGAADAPVTETGDAAQPADASQDEADQVDAAPACEPACSVDAPPRCAGEGSVLECAAGPDGCLGWQEASCPPGDGCWDGACLPCAAGSGTFEGQRLIVEGEARFYYLHVPVAYECTSAWPVLVDLHGTAGPPSPEQAYGLAAAKATADAEGFLLVRPRSRSSTENGYEVFRWDQNPCDPERNARFLVALMSDLATRYHLDPERIYLMGFSSGTNQTSVLLADPQSPFSGYGFVGGGAWSAPQTLPTDARLFLTTGFRDYMRPYHDNLLEMLDIAGVSAGQRLIRETDAGHELYGWMYTELWPFLDRAESPPPGAGLVVRRENNVQHRGRRCARIRAFDERAIPGGMAQ